MVAGCSKDRLRVWHVVVATSVHTPGHLRTLESKREEAGRGEILQICNVAARLLTVVPAYLLSLADSVVFSRLWPLHWAGRFGRERQHFCQAALHSQQTSSGHERPVVVQPPTGGYHGSRFSAQA